MTPCYVAKKYGCRVVGVEIYEKMIDRAEERAKRDSVADRVEFRVADPKELIEYWEYGTYVGRKQSSANDI
jgi:arsenite methyltransferase